MRAIGFWFSPLQLWLPRPQRLVDPAWSRDERATVAAYLRAGTVLESYRGYSFCRFRCGIDSADMGLADFGDGEWVWPEGLAHYIEAHNVQLPEEFVARALARRTPDPPSGPARGRDAAWWLQWASKQGACVAFARSWSEISVQDALTMQKQLVADGVGAATLVARRDDGDAVLCWDFRVLSLRTGELLASASEADEASFERATEVPAMTVPTEADLRSWTAKMVARSPLVKEVETVVAWIPDGLGVVVEPALAAGRFILLGAQPGIGGQWQRFYRQP